MFIEENLPIHDLLDSHIMKEYGSALIRYFYSLLGCYYEINLLSFIEIHSGGSE